MLALSDPGLAYRRTSFDARLLAASAQDMVIVCLDDLLANLVRFEQADLRGNREARSGALTRCVAALTALEIGIDRDAHLGGVLAQFYASAKAALLAMIVEIEVGRLRAIKADFEDIRRSFSLAR